jgi:hypothetical protein
MAAKWMHQMGMLILAGHARIDVVEVVSFSAGTYEHRSSLQNYFETVQRIRALL